MAVRNIIVIDTKHPRNRKSAVPGNSRIYKQSPIKQIN